MGRLDSVKGVTPVSDLRQQILDASVALIEAEGLGALSLREVARRAGVSHQAPYHYFADRAAIAIPAGHRGPAFLMLPNFKVVMIWNRSVLYAISVGVLARQIAGGPGLLREPPGDDQPISRESAIDLQQRLIKLTRHTDEADGLIGPKTRASIRAFQIRAGLVADGHPSPETLVRLRAATP